MNNYKWNRTENHHKIKYINCQMYNSSTQMRYVFPEDNKPDMWTFSLKYTFYVKKYVKLNSPWRAGRLSSTKCLDMICTLKARKHLTDFESELSDLTIQTAVFFFSCISYVMRKQRRDISLAWK